MDLVLKKVIGGGVMKSSWFSVGSLCGRRFLRLLRAYVVLFAIHQVFTLPLFTALLRFGMEENPVSSILETRSFVEQYENMTGAEPSSLAETRAPRADEFVLTTGAQYAPLRERYDGMILAEKRPRRRTLVPFPMGTWGVYAVKPKSCDYGVRIVQSDWETRRLYAFIAKQEGGGFNFAASFVLDALIYAFWFAAALFYVYLQTRKRRAEATTFERFERFRDACFAFRDQTGRFPNSLEDLGAEDASEFRDAFRRREFLCLSTLGVGVVAATPPGGAEARERRAVFRREKQVEIRRKRTARSARRDRRLRADGGDAPDRLGDFSSVYRSRRRSPRVQRFHRFRDWRPDFYDVRRFGNRPLGIL